MEGVLPVFPPSARTIYLLQRKTTKVAGHGRDVRRRRAGGDGPGQDHRLDPPRQPGQEGRADAGVRGLCDTRALMPGSGVEYKKIDDAGLHVTVGGKDRLLEVDTVVVCAGQSPMRCGLREMFQCVTLFSALVEGLQDAQQKFVVPTHVIGGADVAVRLPHCCRAHMLQAELDAKRAIKQGTDTALKL